MKENFQNLLTALRGDLAQHRNERDNLRDEVVPQLRARLDVLEAESTDFQKLTYETTRMQQELQSVKEENTTLTNARKFQQDTQHHSPRFNSIAEEGSSPAVSTSPRVGISRSNTVARGSGMGAGISKTVPISRSNSVSTRERESRDSLSDRVRDIEMQRDALHSALKSLLDRQKYQTREHEKKVRALEQDRERLLQAQSPRRMGYEMEVRGLRNEINHLRRRADEALEQKWRCEKGLGGLKKDLDRAEQETSSLRTLLHENDILVPDLPGRSPQEIQADTHATSASLERAYKELQATQASSVARLRELRGLAPSAAEDTNTAETMDLLVKSMSDAEAERDLAQRQAEAYRAQAESLQGTEAFHSGENHGLAEQLHASADRVESLAAQVRDQLEANSTLRARLAEAVGRGEREQKASATRINTLQGRLKLLEDKVMVAQQHSEDAVSAHEDEVLQMRESHNVQLQRFKSAFKPGPLSSSSPAAIPNTATYLPSPTGAAMARSPLSPLLLVVGAKSPRLDRTTSGAGMSMTEALRTEFLEKRVEELEAALREADREMEEVVQRMNAAQIEVGELQSARYVFGGGGLLRWGFRTRFWLMGGVGMRRCGRRGGCRRRLRRRGRRWGG